MFPTTTYTFHTANIQKKNIYIYVNTYIKQNKFKFPIYFYIFFVFICIRIRIVFVTRLTPALPTKIRIKPFEISEKKLNKKKINVKFRLSLAWLLVHQLRITDMENSKSNLFSLSLSLFLPFLCFSLLLQEVSNCVTAS